MAKIDVALATLNLIPAIEQTLIANALNATI